MSRRVVLAPDVLLAAVGGTSEGDGAAARRALRGWVEQDTDLLVAAPVWPALLDGLRSRGWPAARIVEALHALDDLGLVTVEADRPAVLLAVDGMERYGLKAPAAAAVVLAGLEAAALATADPVIAGAADESIVLAASPAAEGGTSGGPAAGSDVAGAGAGAPPRRDATRRSSLPDYRGLGALLGELRRAATEGRR